MAALRYASCPLRLTRGAACTVDLFCIFGCVLWTASAGQASGSHTGEGGQAGATGAVWPKLQSGAAELSTRLAALEHSPYLATRLQGQYEVRACVRVCGSGCGVYDSV